MRTATLLASLCALSLLSGCAGYKLGPTNNVEAGAKSIRLDPFANQTFEPRLGDAITAALRKSLQRDGTYRLSTAGDADLVVQGIVTRYIRRELSFVPNDVLTIRDFRVMATAQVTLRDTRTGKFESYQLTGYSFVRVGSDLTSAERQAIPLVAEDLARKVTATVVDGRW